MDLKEELALSRFTYPMDGVVIAKEPCSPRDHSRLLVLHRDDGRIEHKRFNNLPEYLRPGDVIVVNASRVIPARLTGVYETGGKVELLLVEQERPGVWSAMMRGRGRPGQVLLFGPLTAKILEKIDIPTGATVRVEFSGDPLPFGEVPLPPYIAKNRIQSPHDAANYQTVYAEVSGSSAAPTAGLHFTPELIARIRNMGVEWLTVDHRIGPGTFRPVEAPDLRDHLMHEESYSLSEALVSRVALAKTERRRVIAVGTSAVRALESSAQGGMQAGEFRTRLWIYPGFHFQTVDAMVTNFHQPESPPLVMTAAFAGTSRLLSAYGDAVKLGYRFYSFGDAMVVL